MSLINTTVQPFKAQAYQNGKFIEVTDQTLKGLAFGNDQPVVLSKEDVLARYLYCLEKLGVPQWKGEFEGDFTAAFRQLDASLAAHRGQ